MRTSHGGITQDDNDLNFMLDQNPKSFESKTFDQRF